MCAHNRAGGRDEVEQSGCSTGADRYLGGRPPQAEAQERPASPRSRPESPSWRSAASVTSNIICVAPGSPWRPARPRSCCSMRPDSCSEVPRTSSPPEALTCVGFGGVCVQVWVDVCDFARANAARNATTQRHMRKLGSASGGASGHAWRAAPFRSRQGRSTGVQICTPLPPLPPPHSRRTSAAMRPHSWSNHSHSSSAAFTPNGCRGPPLPAAAAAAPPPAASQAANAASALGAMTAVKSRSCGV